MSLKQIRKSIGLEDGESEEKPDIETQEPNEDVKDDEFTLMLKESDPLKKEGDDPKGDPEGEPKKELTDKEMNFAALRKKTEELENENKKLRESAPDRFKPIADILSEDGIITDKIVKDFVDKYKSTSEEVESLRQDLEKKESLIRDVDIRRSKEWQEGYEKPYQESRKGLYAELVNVDSSGEAVNNELVEEFALGLISHVEEEGEVDHVKVKSTLKKFAAQYEEQTGDEYDMPSMRDVISSLKSIVENKSKAESAYQDWEKASEAKRAELSENEIQEKELVQKENRRSRFESAQKALDEFGEEDMGGFDKSEVESAFTSVFKANEDGISDPSKAMSYGEVVKLQAKGILYQKAIEENKALRDELDEIKGSSRSGFRGGAENSFGKSSRKESEGLSFLRKKAGLA